MARSSANLCRVSVICLAVALLAVRVGAAYAQDSGARICLLEDKLIQAPPGSRPAVSYSVRDIGRIVGAVRLALPEAGGHALVLTEAGKVWAWGDNRRSQLGVGDTAVHPEWVAVVELDSVVAIAAGAAHSVALRPDGSVWTWGANEYGQSGDGSQWARNLPVRVQGIRDVVAVAAGAQYTLALRRDGTVWAWGSNWTGVAPGVTERTLVAPVEVRGLQNVAAIWVKGDRPYARDAEGRQWTWGTPEAGVRQVERPLEPGTSWPGLLGRDRVVRVLAGALEVEENREVVAQFEVGSAPVDLQAGWAVGWIEGSILESGYALASEAAGMSGPRAAESALALAASTTTLGSAPNPSVFGAPVTLTATVSPSDATGRVTFYDGTTVLGVGTLASGTATLSTISLPAGSRSLRAYYGGDTNYRPSTSASVAPTVNAQAANSFLPAVSYAAGTGPNSVAVGDFNRDGRADLIVTNYQSGNVSVMLGNGDGSFQAAVNYLAGSAPTTVTVGDFNADGTADLAVARYDLNVSVLLGGVNGTFQAPVGYAAGIIPYTVVAGDFNADGKVDLATGDYLGVSVLLGNGDGAFQTAVRYGVAGGVDSATIVDIDGDGDADLVGANDFTAYLSALLGNGDGTFQTALTYLVGTPQGAVVAGDLNGDGKADLATANPDSDSVSVLLGNGNGTYRAAVRYGTGYRPRVVAIGDFNGDGNTDLATANHESNSASILFGNGDGTFQAAVNSAVGKYPRSLAVGDFNGDGKADLAVANGGSNNVSLLLGTWVQPASDPTTTTLAATPNPSVFGQPVTLTATVTPSAAIGQVTFYDGTTVLGMGTLIGGKATLATISLPAGSLFLRAHYGGDAANAASTSASTSQTVYAQPANTFLAAVDYATGGGPTSVSTADFNGDGISDLAVANFAASSVSVLLGDGDATFRPAVNYPAVTSPKSVLAGDFNGDGKADLVVASPNGVSTLLGNGDGTFRTVLNILHAVSPRSAAIGDFNADGIADLAAAGNGGVSALLGNGDGTFQMRTRDLTGDTLESVAAGDFNGDGKADLAVVKPGSNNIGVLLGSGDGTFQAAVNYAVGNYPHSVTVGDLDGDGKADLAVADSGSNAVSVLLGNGDGTFQTAADFAAGVGPVSVAIGDFNGDGKADLFVADYTGDTVSVLLGNGNGTFQTRAGYWTGTSPVSLAIGDFNGDGRADLASANWGSRNVSVLLSSWAPPASATKATSTALIATPNPASFGQAVTWTAAVTPSAATGHVTFYDGVTVLGVGTLANGSASFATSLLPAGRRLLRAHYEGDATYIASTSGLLAQMVIAQPANSFLSAGNYGGDATSEAVGDFNGDGKADLALAGSSNTVSVVLGNGDGTFQTAVNYETGSGAKSVAAGDFNGDGKTDLAVANSYDKNVSVLLGNGDATFQQTVNYPIGFSLSSLVVGDFNGDGEADLAVAHYSGISILLGGGDGTFSAPVGYASVLPFLSMAVGDFNGDGIADLTMVIASTVGVVVMLGNGDGTFRGVENYAVVPNATWVAVGDLNGDGRADLAVARDYTVSVVFGNGDGTFRLAGRYETGLTARFVAIGDFNGDAKPDLAVTNSGDNTLSVLLGNGDGTFRAAVNYTKGSGHISVAIGDFNGDGMADLALGARILLGTWVGPALTTSTTTLAAAPNPSTLGGAVTLTATVSPAAVTGEVAFYDGTALLDAVILAGGTATLATNSLPAGDRSLRAYYMGDASHQASASEWVAQTVTSTAPEFRYVGSMPQLASGNYWKTTITLVNHGSTAARARVDFFDNSGGPLALPITYPSLPPADPVLITGVERTIEPGASFSFFSTGPVEETPRVGWAQLLTDGDISGFAVFRQEVHREQEAVVPIETHNSDAYVLYFNNSGDFATGVAVANVVNQPAAVVVIMRDEAGTIFDTQTLQLPALGHTSFPLAEKFPQTHQRIGSLEFRTPQGGQISVLGLRFNGISFTTIPALDRSLQTPTAPSPSLMPAGSAAQVASGHYWETTITLVNKGNFSARAKLEFLDNQGDPLVLPITFSSTPGVPAAMLSTVERTLGPGASLSLSSTGPVDVETVGWARFMTDGDVGGFAIFRQNVDGAQEALVPIETGDPDAWLLWFDNTGTFATGVAVVNNSATPAGVQVIVRDEVGVQIHSQTLGLAGLGHVSGAMTDLIGHTGDQVGSLEFRTPPGSAITVLGLRFNGVSFTTIPVMPEAVP